jgi:hypothetical protein
MRRPWFFFGSLLLCVSILLCTTCSKEYSYEGGPVQPMPLPTDPLAEFSLSGAPDSCSPVQVNGDYISGQTLTASNTVLVTATVTRPGRYTIQTDTVDGISFSKSGTFITTGSQQLALQASGTLLNPGNPSFLPRGGNSACRFSLLVLPGGPPASYVLESGANHACTNFVIVSPFVAGLPVSTSNAVSLHVFVTAVGNYAIITSTLNGLSFAASGVFASAGAQTVVLAATGTPQQAGTFSYLPQIMGPHPIGGESCTFDLVVN